MKNKQIFFKVIVLICMLCLISNSTVFAEDIVINLLYPKANNKLKLHSPVVIKGIVKIEVRGIRDKQKKQASYWLEYYLNDDLVFSTKDDNIKEFYLNTVNYPNGSYNLTVNLWDKDSDSAIGIERVQIRN